MTHTGTPSWQSNKCQKEVNNQIGAILHDIIHVYYNKQSSKKKTQDFVIFKASFTVISYYM